MPGAGFYAIHTAKLKFASDGRWYADDEPIVHARLALLFSRHVRRKACGGYEIWIGEPYHADVEIEDTPYVVTTVTAEADATADPSAAPRRFLVQLNDGTTEPLDADGVQVGAENVLYCHVKGGAERARFLRPAYYQLAQFIEESGGQFQLRCGGSTHVITHA